MQKELKKMILRAYKTLNNQCNYKLSKQYYYTLALYVEEFFNNEWHNFSSGYEKNFYIDEEGKVNYEAMIHHIFYNDDLYSKLQEARLRA